MRGKALLRLFLALALTHCAVSHSLAQRTRFPGDSPTRPAVMNGKVLGTPSYRRPVVPTFTIPQGGYGGYGCYSYYDYYPSLYYSGFAYGYSSGYCPTCGCLANQCVCGPTWYFPGRWVDYRAVYGFSAPVANQPPAAPARAARLAAADPIDRLPPAPELPDRAASVQLKKAWRYIDLGDRYLREGRVRDAHARYRRAAAAAPDLAAVRFRQTMVELALGNIEDASDALRQGLRMDPNWPESKFDLTTVFSEDGRQAVQSRLDERLLAFPNDADALVLRGVLSHFAGAEENAQRVFAHAVQVSGGASVARLFLAEQPEARDAAQLMQ